MLSINAIASTTVAGHYYSQADYYAKDGHDDITSLWQGRGAALLGLDGTVAIDDFKALLDGKLPDGSVVGRAANGGLTQHKKGWDFTLSAPKSVSVLALAGGDKRLIGAHNAAVAAALQHLENNHSITRQQISGEITDVATRNLTVASFTHTTSRAMDPQLHTHNVIMNLTRRPDGQWRSLESRRMYDVSTLIGQVYRNNLAARVKALGYDIDVDASKGTFDISCVPESVRKGFSKRREAILAAAKAYGYSTAKGMDKAAVRTRDAKQHSNETALLTAWSDQLAALRFDPGQSIQDATDRVAAGHVVAPSPDDHTASLDFARTHLAEREAVFSADELLQQTMRVGLGHSTIDDVERAIDQNLRQRKLVPASIKNGRSSGPGYTTPQAIAKEKYIIKLMRRGKGEVPRIAPARQVSALIEDRGFTPGQAAAVRLLLSSKDRVLGVQGYAGTGKTYMLSAVKELADQRGFRVTGLAPTGSAASQLRAETGIQSQTLASHLMVLKNRKTIRQDKKEILIVDEASLQNTQDAADLLTFSRRTRSRIFLIGDRQQLGAIEAGKPFELLIKAGMAHAQMRDIMRQQDNPDLKAAVEAAIDRRPRAALDRISSTVHEIENQNERIDAIIDRIKNLSEPERERMLVLIPDNKTRAVVNERIRAVLQEKGIVGKNEITLVGLTNRGLTRAEKGRARFYRKNDVVVFGRDVRRLGIRADQSYTVARTSDSEVTLTNSQGLSIRWNPSTIAGRAKNGVEVYQQEQRALAAGDEIRWRRKHKSLGVNSTDVGRVTSIDDDSSTATIRFKRAGAKTIDLKTNRHWEHAYATTVYAGQGATYDEAIVHAESWRRNLINQKSFYVALSRAKFDSHIYTDSVDELGKGVAKRLGEKSSALEGKGGDDARFLDQDGLSKESLDAEDRRRQESILVRVVGKIRRGFDIELEI